MSCQARSLTGSEVFSFNSTSWTNKPQRSVSTSPALGWQIQTIILGFYVGTEGKTQVLTLAQPTLYESNPLPRPLYFFLKDIKVGI